MRVVSVLQAQSMRIVRMVTHAYMPTIVMGLGEKYKFVGLPTREELLPLDPTNATLTFRTGRCDLDGREVVIDSIKIFSNAVALVTRTNTADSDRILDEAMSWAAAAFEIAFEPLRPGVIHTSQLEVVLERPLADLFPILRRVESAITENLDDSWEIRPPHEVVALNFWFDKNVFPAFAPPPFRIDRRDGVPFDQNCYWSEATMTTDRHIATLSMLEQLCPKAIPA